MIGALLDARVSMRQACVLEHKLASYAAAGRSWVGLGVDTENITGASRLYESAGMRSWIQVDAFRRRVRADG
jgi:mycothiol synthase